MTTTLTSRLLLALAVVLPVLAACSSSPKQGASAASAPSTPESQPPQYNSRASQALNVAIAAGLTDPVKGPLFDLKRGDLPADLRTQPAQDVARQITRGLDLTMAANLFTGGGLGMSAGSHTTMGALYLVSAIAGGPPKHPAAKYQEIVWMPKSFAASPDAASEQLKSMTMQAVAKVLADQGWSTRQIEADTGGLMKKRIETLTTYVGGDVCGVQAHCILKTYADRPIDAAQTPTVARTGAAWVWRNGLHGQEKSFDKGFSWALSELDINPPHAPNYKRRLVLDFEDLTLRMTAHLPAWVYLYRPPSTSRPYPRIYNQGNELTFVEPL